MGWSTPLVGRVTELEQLRHAAARARAGNPSAVLVHGEPGVGKTRLVTDVAAELGQQGFQVLRGRCVRFAAEASSYLPIAQALGSRFELADAATGGATVLHRVGAVVEDLMASGPVALVVDDMQWADLSSLDVLTYLVAGFTAGQPMLILGTYRDTELGAGHPLHGWLADMRRMPDVSFVSLCRFDRHDTALLVESVLGAPSHASLVEQTFHISDGNAYLVELLVLDLAPSVDRLPTALPGGLREALLASWHRLGAPTRELMQVLAVGGRPVDVGVFQQVAAAVGMDPDKVTAGIAEATDAGLTTVGTGGSVWFHHPLVAEVLVATVLAPEAARLHTEYVAVWLAANRAPERVRSAHLALHSEAAGDVSAALGWSLRAAGEAERVRGYAEESHHLARACGLWPEADEAAQAGAGAYVGLLIRATRAAHRAGDLDTALSLGERAYELADRQADPLSSCRVLNELNILRLLHGTRPSLATLQEAVTLSCAYPRSPEHVRALAELSVHERHYGVDGGEDRAQEALRIARDCGSDDALAHALQVAAKGGWGDPGSLVLAEEAVTLARRTQNQWLISNAAISWARCLLALGRGPEATPVLLELHDDLVRAGAPHEAAKMAIYAADLLLWFGEWSQCRSLLRDAMTARMPALWARWARLTAAELAVRCGQVSAAQQHTRRAEELGSAGDREPRNGFIAATVDVLAARGRRREAVALITREIRTVVRSDPTLADDLMARAAAAAADVVQLDPGLRTEATSMLDDLVAIRTALLPPMFEPLSPDDLVPLACGALFRAHRSRASSERGGGIDGWEHAVGACDTAGLVWEAAQARYRLGAALLAQRRSRSRASTALREALQVAVDLGAEPLRADIEALALQAHLALDEPEDGALERDGLPVLAGLTKREHEVLGHVVAGRTYSQIAEALFISEKTVSVHVSNLLRKTRTANRIQLSTLARRRSAGQG